MKEICLSPVRFAHSSRGARGELPQTVSSSFSTPGK